MSHPIKTVIRFFLFGLCWGTTCFTAMMAMKYVAGGPDEIIRMLPNFLSQVLGALIVGLAFTMPAILYRISKIPTPVSVLIHMAVGMGISGPIAVYFGWLWYDPTAPGMLIGEICLGCAIFGVIWLGFYLLNRHEAKAINKRVQQLTRSENDSPR